MSLTRPQLDSLQCQIPGCTHQDHSGEFFFHSRCHMKAGSHVAMIGEEVHVHCAVCEAMVAAVKTSDSALMVGIREHGNSILVLCPACGDDAPTVVSYSKGTLHIACLKCNSPLAWATVSDDSPPAARRKNFLRGN